MKINESIEIFLPISMKKPNNTDILGAIIKFINQLIRKKGTTKMGGPVGRKNCQNINNLTLLTDAVFFIMEQNFFHISLKYRKGGGSNDQV